MDSRIREPIYRIAKARPRAGAGRADGTGDGKRALMPPEPRNG